MNAKKPLRLLGSIVFLGLAWNLLARPAQAAIQYFDTNGATAGDGLTTGGTFVWSTSANTLWSSSSVGTAATVAFSNGAGNTAYFNGITGGTATSYTVGVDNSIFNLSEGINIGNVTAGTITLANAASNPDTNFYINSSGTLWTINSGSTLIDNLTNSNGALNLNLTTLTLTGAGNVTFSGSGVKNTGSIIDNLTGDLQYTVANTYTGGTTVNSGRLIAASATATFGTGGVTVASGGEVYMGSGQTLSNSFSIAGVGGNSSQDSVQRGALRLDGNSTISGSVVLTGSAAIDSHSGTGTVSGPISGGFGLTINKSDAATIVLSGSNTFSGGLTIGGGTLTASLGMSNSAGSSIGPANNAISIASGAMLNLTDTANNFILTGSLSGAGTINQNDGATIGVRLSGNNSGFTGTFQQQTTTRFLMWDSANASSSAAAWVLNASTSASTAPFAAAEYGAGIACSPGFASGTSNTISLGALSSTSTSMTLGNFTGTASQSGTTSFSVGALNTNTTFAGVIANTVPGSMGFTSSLVSLTKVGTGTLTLSNSNTFSGGMTISSGTVVISTTGSANGLGSGSVTIAAATGGSAALAFNGNTSNFPTFTNPLTVSGSGANLLYVTSWNPVFSGSLSLTNNLTIGSNNSSGSSLTFNGGVGGSGNITVSIDNTGNGTGSSFVTFGSAAVNNSGTLTFNNASFNGGPVGSGTGSNTITGGVGSNVTAITQASNVNPLTISTNALSINAGGTTLTASGSALFTVSGGISGTGNLVLNNNSTNAAGISISTTAVNPVGSITNSGNGSGGVSISSAIGGNVTGIIQNSLTSPLILSGVNTYTVGTTISAGTLQISGSGSLSSGAYAANIADGGLLLYGSSAAQNLSGSISGTGGLNQAGPGTLTLSASNGYTGVTTIRGGILSLANSAALPGGNITFTGGSLQYSASNNLDYSGNIVNSTAAISLDTNGQSINFATSLASSNTGGLTVKSTAAGGVLTLANANNFSGVTLVSSGSLVLGNSLSLQNSTFDASGSGTFSFGTLTAATFGGLQGTSGTLDLDNTTPAALALTAGNNNATTTYNGILTGSGSLTKIGTGTLTLGGSNSYIGGTLVNQGILSVSSSTNLSSTIVPNNITLNGGTLQTGSLLTLSANQGLIIGASGGGIFGSNATHTLGFVLASPNQLTGSGQLTLGGAGNQTDTLMLTAPQSTFGGNILISSGRLEVDTTGSTALGSGTVTVASGATLGFGADGSFGVAGANIPNTLVIAGTGDANGAIHVKVASATFSGPIVLSGPAQIGADSTSTVSLIGPISGGFPMTFGHGSGDKGLYVLSASNSYVGTTVSTGTLQLSGSATLGATSGALAVINSGMLDLNGTSQTVGALGGTGGLIVNNSGSGVSTLTAMGGTSSTVIADNTTGAGQVALVVSGGVTLSGSNTYSGATTVSSGFFQLTGANGAGAGSGAVNLITAGTGSAGSSLLLAGGAQTYANAVTGAGYVENFNGTAATVVLTGSLSYTGNTYFRVANDNFNFAPTANSTISGVIGATTGGFNGTEVAGGSVTKSGSAMLTLTSANLYTGTTLVSGGTLLLANNLALQNSTFDASGAGTLSFGTLTTATFGGLQGASGTLNLSNATPAAVALTVGNNGGTTTYSGILTGNGSLALIGTGALTLAGSNSYTGLTTVSAGTMTVTGNETAATGGWSIVNNSNSLPLTANFNAGSTIAVAGSNTFQIGVTFANGTTESVNVAGVVSNSGALNVQRSASFTISSGGVWTQLGPMLLASPSGSGGPNNMTVASGGLFTYNTSSGSLIQMPTSTNVNPGGGDLTISGTFATNEGFINATTSGTIGTSTITLAGGDLVLLANIPVLTASSGSASFLNFTLGTGGGTLNTNGFSTTMNLPISGANPLTKTGSGMLTLSGLNTYSGSTSITGGTLSTANIVVSGGASGLGNATSAVVLNGGDLSYTGNSASYTRGFTIGASGGEFDVTTSGQTVTISSSLSLSSGSMTFGGAGNTIISTGTAVPLTGANTLTKNGAGALTLQTTSTASIASASAMPIVINAGTLAQNITVATNLANSLGTGRITIVPGAAFTASNAGATDSYANALSISNSAGTATLQDNSGLLTFSGSVAFAGGASTPTLELNNTNNSAGSFLTLSGSISGPGNIAADGSGGGSPINLTGTSLNNSGTITNNGTNATGVLTISGGTVGSNVTGIFSTSVAPTNVSDLILVNSASGTTLQAGGAGKMTISGGVSGTGNLTLNNNSSTAAGITVSTASINNNGTITSSGNGSGGVTISSVVGAAVIGVIQNGSNSALTLSGPNTYTSATTISAGTLQAGVATVGGVSPTSGALGINSALTINGGATLNLNGFNETIGALSDNAGSGGAITSGTTGAVTLITGGNNASTSFAGTIQNGAGTLSLTKIGSGTLVLSGSNTYSGSTTISGGALQIGNGGATGSIDSSSSVSVASLALLAFSRSDNYGYTGSSGFSPAISGAGGVLVSAGTLAISSPETYTGGTTINNSEIKLNGTGGQLPSLAASAAGGSGGALTLSSGTLDLEGTAQTVGALNGNAGSLITDNEPGTVSENGTTFLTVSFNSGSSTYAGVIADGPGALLSLTTSGSGTLVLSGSNAYSGGTTVSAGVLQIGSSAALPAGTAGAIYGTLDLGSFNASLNTLTGTGTVGNLTGGGSNTLTLGANGGSSTFGGTIQDPAGPLAVYKTGSGSFTLAGASTYVGGTTMNNGTLVLANSSGSALGTGNLTLNGGTLAGTTFGGTISGLVQAGSAAHTIAPGAGLSSGYGILNLAGGLNGNTFTTLAFNLNLSSSSSTGGNGEPIYVGDMINLGGSGLSGSGNLAFGGVTPGIGDYRLMGGTLGSPNLNNFTLPSFSSSADTFSLSTTADSGYLDLVVTPGTTTTTSTTYNLAAAAGASLLHVGFSTTVSATITNAGSGLADSLDYSGLNLSASAGSLSGGGLPISGGPLAQGQSNSGSQTYTASTPGVITLTPTVTGGSNATIGGSATLGATTSATINVFSGDGTWNSSSGSLWGIHANSNWTDAYGVHAAPGTFGSFTNTDTATFSGSGSVTSIDLSGANPSLAALSFSNSNCTLAGGTLTLNSSTGTASITVSGTQTISSFLNLASSADMIVNSGSDLLALSGPIAGSGSLLKDGAGELLLSGSNSFSGGTDVNNGTLVVAANGAIPDGTSLSIGAGGTLVFDSTAVASPIVPSPLAASSGVVAVPEPGTLVLLAALWSAIACYRFSKRPRRRSTSQA